MNGLHRHRHAIWQQITNISFLLPFFFVLTSVIAALSVLVPAQAATSDTLNFQGRLLTNTGGLVPDGTYNVEFNLYNVSSGGSTLWTEDRLNTNTQGVTVRNGYFSVYLGDYDAFGAINWDQDLWLGMTIRGTSNCAWGSCTPADSEMTPRFKLSAVPYAFRANQLAASNGANTATLSFTTPTANRTITLPDDSGTVCLTSGNCVGVGGTGDILDGGQAGAISVGTTDNTTLSLLQNGSAALTVNTSQLLQFNAYNCSTYANGGTLTTDASGNVVCQDDNGGGASGISSINTLTASSLTIQGTLNEIEITDNSSDTITIGLPDDVTIGSDLTVTNTLTVNSTSAFNGDITVSAGYSLTLAGGNTASRPGTPTTGELYYDTDTDSFLVYNGTKWVSDQRDAIYVASTSTSSQADQDRADFLTDGVDDQVQINAALSAAAGARVVLLDGTYTTHQTNSGDATIFIPNNTTLTGVGIGTSIELGDIDATDNLIENSDTATGTGVIVKNLTLDGRDDINTAGTQHGIYFNNLGDSSSNLDGGVLNGLNIQNFRSYGVSLNVSSNIDVVNNASNYNNVGIFINNSDYNYISENTTNNNSTGISINNSSSVRNTISGNVAIGNSTMGISITTATSNIVESNTILSNSVYGLYLMTNSNNNNVSNNIINNNGWGLVISGTSNDNNISGNSVDSNTNHGIYVANGNYNNVSSNTADGNLTGLYIAGGSNNYIGNNIINSTQRGVHIQAADYNNFIGGRIYNSASNGLYIVAGADYNLFSSVTFVNNGGSGAVDSIYVNNSDSNQFKNNSINDSSGTGYAINISAANVDNTYLSNNTYVGSGASSINDLGTNTIYEGQLDGSGNYDIDPVGTIELLSNTNITGTLTVSGLTTLNGGLTIEAGDTLTFNTDAFTDFTGGGLYNNAGVLSVDNTVLDDNFFIQNGNSFSANAVLGTNDAFSLLLETNGTTALTIDTSQNGTFAGGLTVTGSTTLNGNVDLGDASTDTITFVGQVDSNIIPDTDDTYDLGSSTLRWRDLYLGPASLHIGTNGNEGVISYDTIGNDFEFNQAITAGGALTVTGLTTLNGGLTVEAGDTFTFNGEGFTDLTGTGLQFNTGSLETVVGETIESSEITDGTIVGTDIASNTVANSNLVNSQLAVNTGSGLQGGGNISLGGSRNLSLGNLTSDWTQSGAFDIVLNNAGSGLRILEASGGLYYGEFDVADLNATRLYTFPDADGEVSVLGQTIENGELEFSSVTVGTGTGLSGGGAVSLGGSLSLTANLGDDIATGEIVDGTILAADLNTTNALGAGVDGYVYSYNNATGNFTLVDSSTFGGSGVTSLNTLTGALSITGTSYLTVTPSGSSVALAIANNSLTATQLGANSVNTSELASTTVSAGSYGSASSVGTFTVDADGRLTAASDSAIAIAGTQITTGTIDDLRLSSNVALLSAANTFTAAGTALTVTNNATVNGVLTVGTSLTVGTTNFTEADLDALDNGTIEGSEITNGTIEAVDIESTNVAGAGTDGYILTYDNATGGFTYVDAGTVGTTLSEAQVEAYIFDADNTGTLSSGTLALGSLSYTGNLTVSEGGTGLTSAGVAGGIYYSTGTAFANNGVGTAGQCLLSAGAGAPTWGNCGGSGAGAVTLQVAYDQGNTITTTDNRNLAFTLANTTTDSDFVVNIATSSTSEIAFQYNASTLLRVDSSGIDLIDVDVADFTGATVTFDAGEILETEIAQNSLDDSEIQDNSLTASSLANNSVATAEILDSTILEADLDATNAAVNTYVLTYDSGSGGFTWVSQASVAGSAGVTSLNSLTGALSIVGNSQITVNPSGSNVNLSITADSIGDSQLAFNTGQHLTTTSTPTFAGLLSNGQLQVNSATNQIAIIDADTASTEWTFSTVGDQDLGFYENGLTQRLLLSAAGDLTASGDITVSGGNIIIGSTNISESDISPLDDGSIDLTSEVNNTLPVANGGTGAATLVNGVLFGNGTSPISSTGVLGNGQLIIGDGTGNPTIGTLTQGTGITVTNGAGTITIASTLGTNINSTEIVDGTILEVDLAATNTPGAPEDGYILSFDNGTGGFTWVDPAGVGGLSEAQVEAFIFDADNTGTLSSGTLALNSLSYTGSLGVSNGGTGLSAAGTAGTVFFSNGTAFANTAQGSAGECLKSNGSGTPYWSACGGSGSGSSLQIAYDEGNIISTTDNRNILFNLTDTTTDSTFVVDLQASGSQFEVQDAGSTNFIVDGAGNVGIGAAANASYKLDVTGAGRFTSSLTVNGDVTLGDAVSDSVDINGTTDITGTLNSGTLVTINNTGTSSALALDIDSGITGSGDVLNVQSNTLVVQGDGKVGIATTGPANILDVLASNADEGADIGTAFVGNWGGASFASYAAFYNKALGGASTTSYALLQSNAGDTFVNAAPTRSLYLRINNGTVLQVSAGAVTITGTLNVSSTATVGNLECTNCIDEGDLAQNQIDDSEIQDNSLTALSLAANSVGASEIAAGAVGTSEVADNTLTATDLAANSVGASEIAAGAVGTSEIADNTVSTTDILNNTITNNDLQFDTGQHLTTTSGVQFASVQVNGSLTASSTAELFIGVSAARGNTHLCIFSTRVETCTSSRALKKDIRDTDYGLAELRQLRPVQYAWKADGRLDAGFIAEEAALIIPETTQWNPDGTVNSFNYDAITSLNTKSIQQLDLIVQSNTSRINNLEATNTSLTKLNLNVTDLAFIGRLKVNGLTELSDLSVSGLTEVQDIMVNGKIITAGDVPTAVLAATTGQGSSFSIEGNDIAGSISITAGTETLANPLAAGSQIDITFDNPFDEIPRISLTPTNDKSANVNYFVTKSVTGFSIHFTDVPIANTKYSFDYQILQ